MTVNYAEKFSQKVDERFKREALTTNTINQDFDFIDAETVKVYTVATDVYKRQA